MDLKDYLTISGQSGLFKMVSQGKNAVIVEHLSTKKRMPAYASHRISGLEDIALFTDGDELPLKDVFTRIFKHLDGKTVDAPKKMSADEIKTFFADVIPEYDRDRVYVSDMKKTLQWYNELSELNLITLEEETEAEAEETTAKTDAKAVKTGKATPATKKTTAKGVAGKGVAGKGVAQKGAAGKTATKKGATTTVVKKSASTARKPK